MRPLHYVMRVACMVSKCTLAVCALFLWATPTHADTIKTDIASLTPSILEEPTADEPRLQSSPSEALAILKKTPPAPHFSFAETIHKVAGAVVNLYAPTPSPTAHQKNRLQVFFGSSFASKRIPLRIQQSLGSGVIVRHDGLIVTPRHMIQGHENIRVVTAENEEHSATVLVTDARLDLAILKISGTKLPFIELVSMTDLQVGEHVCAVGNPFGRGIMATRGCISALGWDDFNPHDHRIFIQTDAAVNRGNAGGALVTTQGKLAGINTLIASHDRPAQGLNFAIPTDFLLSLIKAADEKRTVQHPWIGMTVQPISKQIAGTYGLTKTQGAIITSLYKDSPAQAAGLQIGDVITRINGHPIQNDSTVRFFTYTGVVGTKISFTVIDLAHKTRTVDFILPPPPKSAQKPTLIQGRSPLSGLLIDDLSPATADEFNIEYAQEGLIIVQVKPGSTAAKLGFQAGDLLEMINQKPLKTIHDLHAPLRATQGWSIRFNRGGIHHQLRLR